MSATVEVQIKTSHWVSIGFVGLLTFGLGWLLFLTTRGWLRSVGPDGVVLRNGKRFAWSELKTVKPLYVRPRYVRTGYLTQLELVFASGKASLVHRSIANSGEVHRAIEQFARVTIPSSKEA